MSVDRPNYRVGKCCKSCKFARRYRKEECILESRLACALKEEQPDIIGLGNGLGNYYKWNKKNNVSPHMVCDDWIES